jgi:hypothetical protein
MEPNYSTEVLHQIKEYASYLLRPEQIARLIDCYPDEFKQLLKRKKHPVAVAYEKGKTETILAVRKQEIELAKLGSPMAVEMVAKFIIDQELYE